MGANISSVVITLAQTFFGGPGSLSVLHQVLPSKATGGESTLVVGITVGSSNGQELFQPTPGSWEVREVERQCRAHLSPCVVTTTSRFLPLEIDSR